MLMANNTVVQQPTRMQNLTEKLTSHAVDFIDLHSASDEPWFFLMAYAHVHTPLFSSPRFVNKSRGGRFGDNAEEMDWSVGQLLQALKRNNVDNNTLVLFTSDNGKSLVSAESHAVKVLSRRKDGIMLAAVD